MASRSSLYGSSLALPDWVFGGEFGDLAKNMNSRDLGYEQLQQQEQVNDQRQFVLDDLQRQSDIRDTVAKSMGGQQPTSVRDAYQKMVEAAYQSGDPISALKYQAAMDEYDQNQTAKKRKDIADAVNLSDNLTFDRINELFPNSGLTKADYEKNQRRKAAGTGKERSYEFIDDKGVPQLVPASQYNEAGRKGWKRAKGGDSLNDMMMQMFEDAMSGDGAAPGERPAQAQKDLVKEIQQDAKDSNAKDRTRLNSGDIATSDMRIKNRETGEEVIIKKGQRIP